MTDETETSSSADEEHGQEDATSDYILHIKFDQRCD